MCPFYFSHVFPPLAQTENKKEKNKIPEILQHITLNE